MTDFTEPRRMRDMRIEITVADLSAAFMAFVVWHQATNPRDLWIFGLITIAWVAVAALNAARAIQFHRIARHIDHTHADE